jgi:hypothetical protein
MNTMCIKVYTLCGRALEIRSQRSTGSSVSRWILVKPEDFEEFTKMIFETLIRDRNDLNLERTIARHVK